MSASELLHPHLYTKRKTSFLCNVHLQQGHYIEVEMQCYQPKAALTVLTSCCLVMDIDIRN